MPGLLMTDDLNMQALSGTLAERTARSMAAGCDIALHCKGDLDRDAGGGHGGGRDDGRHPGARRGGAGAARSRRTPLTLPRLRPNFRPCLAKRDMADTRHRRLGRQRPQPAAGDRLAGEALIVDVDGFEGPLDLLLMLSRTQKVDLRKISVLQLAEQYLGFVARAQSLRIELAADYLVMAAWLAFLKSRLLLPPEPGEAGPSAEDLAAHLAFQLERLSAMREAAARLMARDQLGRDFFARGLPEDVTRHTQSQL